MSGESGTRALIAASAVAIAQLAAACSHRTVPAPGAVSAPAAGRQAGQGSRGDEVAGQWPTAGADAAGTYYSRLTDINATNVSQLGFAWEYRLGTHRGLEATPVVTGGVMYTSGNFGRVYALDAVTGQPLWIYDPGDGAAGRFACCDAVNRGVAVSNGRVYVGSLDGYVHAIDAKTGQRLWKVDALPARGPKAPYTLTGIPVIAGDLVVVGPGGGDFSGARGYVAAFDAGSGALRWRFYTVPRDPAQGEQDQPHLVEAVKSWDPRHRWETGGGGAVWDGISYDPELHLIYVGTGNAAPYNIHAGGRTGGDDLYSASILAIHEHSGQLAWYYQVVPGDVWDFDSTQKLVLADLQIDGKPRRTILQASKNGFFYVLDRQTGEFISAAPFARVNWSAGIDPKSGRPRPGENLDYTHTPKVVFPWEGGAHNWQPMAFDPTAALAYIPAMDVGDIQVETSTRPAGLVEGQFTSPILATEDYVPAELASLLGPLPAAARLFNGGSAPRSLAYLRAWNVRENKLAWEVATESYWNGGVLATAGGLVVQGDIAGRLNFYDSASGRQLQSVELGTSIMAAPMTYRIGATQYIAVMAGYGGGQLGAAFPDNSAAYRYGNEGRIIALKLGGGPVPLPARAADAPLTQPPRRFGTPRQIATGEILYNRYCSRCHVFGPSVLPDLRHLSAEKHRMFPDIVLKGLLRPVGMGPFDDVLSSADVQAIQAYVLDQTWKEFAARH